MARPVASVREVVLHTRTMVTVVLARVGEDFHSKPMVKEERSWKEVWGGLKAVEVTWMKVKGARMRTGVEVEDTWVMA
jgi:hypothetical protein